MIPVHVPVQVPGAPYEVVVGQGLLASAGELVRPMCSGEAVALITDETVAGRYGMEVDVALARAGMMVSSLTVPAGETSKSWSVAGDVLEALAERRIARTDLVVALGGGVVGDLAGFAAAIYLRGVDFIQIPTTLLAMVDSSVGGKTGVDLRAGKNLVGAFKQPLLVIADTDVLATLPEDQWRSGLAEVAKSAVLAGEAFLAWMETNVAALMNRDSTVVAEAVTRCVEFKAGIVARDEREEGPRECLNLGHTMGHALEKTLGYGTVTHGAAVAEGMRFASRVSVQVAGTDTAFVKRQDRLLDELGLGALQVEVRPRVLLDAMRGDKKARSGKVRMVLAEAPGHWSCEPVADEIVLAHLDAWARTKGGE